MREENEHCRRRTWRGGPAPPSIPFRALQSHWSRHHAAPEPIGKVDVLHVCFPFEIKDFVGESARYIEMFKPSLTLIHSTVGSRHHTRRRAADGCSRCAQPGARKARAHAGGTPQLHEIRGSHGSRQRQTCRGTFGVRRLEDEDPVGTGSNRGGETNRDDLLRLDDCLGAGGREVLRSSGSILRRNRLLL